ncbi:hypothetical protein E2562_021356 [Oryza meyeriana var. granulata]|uniref:Uncharacterized protein n=1 Tax=Oryza meyeriana var. granulata TaxID=110450 RepID=A0A6G1CHZ0_9ORYZ|nr:hypothetical protein E2562_021356 [Oryza meyeriana var. granulata]
METTSTVQAINNSMTAIKAEEGRKTELIKVRQEYVDTLQSRPPRHDLGPSDGIVDRIPSTELCKLIRATMASSGRTR